jgi:hypothetical protein
MVELFLDALVTVRTSVMSTPQFWFLKSDVISIASVRRHISGETTDSGFSFHPEDD